MSTMNISLPVPLKAWVEEQVRTGGYGSASEFFHDLLREAQRRRRIRDEVDSKLLAALDSGEPVEVTPQYWKTLRKEAKKRLLDKSKRAR